MNMQQFEQNRANIPVEELLKHEGNWAALSPDGKRIVASNIDLSVLRQQIIAAGEDPEQTPLEFIGGEEDSYIGGSETIYVGDGTEVD